MQNDCEIYVDPEEDEVFFGCVSEREKFVSAKLVNCAGSSSKDDCKSSEVSDEWNGGEGNGENVLRNERSTKVLEEIFLDDSSDSIQPQTEAKDSSKILSNNNASVELEHNYSTPMKHKIDKSILATPKSVVKADRDGGFLKVLSEIALVKAEAEGNQKSGGEEDEEGEEDKENKLGSGVPEIKITEATPEKGATFSPPRSVSTELRRFRIIYSSPQEDNVDPKSKPESFEGERNLKNKSADRDVEKSSEKEKRKSVDLIDFNECTGEPKAILPGKSTTSATEETDNCEGGGFEKGKPDAIPPRTVNTHATPSVRKPPGGLRFSKEARKIVEVLKKSASADDTLNFTVPEIDVEEEENSFLSPGPLPGFDVTVIPGEKSPPKVLAKPADNKLALKCQTAEKDKRNLTPATSQSKLQTMKYFSERRIYNQIGGEGKSKCAKKLPLEEKRPATTTAAVVEKWKGGGQGELNSRIPVFGGAKSGVARTVGSRTTPAKTPTGKGYKNPKFNHIESPINAYIHNKPTSLLLNVKPETKKDSLTKVWKPQTAVQSERKEQEKTSKLQAPVSAVRLPFVEYKSATPYKIEKRPESRLPRLAPSVMKLIGNHSPKVLRHEGRFYVNSPRMEGATTDNSTIIADPKEVSVVVSQPAQKSNTRK